MKYQYTLTYDAPNIRCSSCSDLIKNVMTSAEKCIKNQVAIKVTKVHVDSISFPQQVTFHVDSDLPKAETESFIKQEMSNIGFTVYPPGGPSLWKIIFHLLAGIGGVGAGLSLMIVMMLGVTLAPWLLYLISGLSVVFTILLGLDTYYEAFNKLIYSRKLSMDTLFSISTLIAMGVSIASLFVPALPCLFDAGLMIFGFRHIGRAVEESVRYHFSKLLSFSERAPKKVTLFRIINQKKTSQKIDVRGLVVHDECEIPAGAYLPVDGECLDETATVYVSNESGNVLAVEVQRGTKLKAGTRVDTANGPLRIKVLQSYEDSYLARLDKTIKDAREEKAPIEQDADKIIQYFIPAVLAVTAIASLGLGVFVSPIAAIYGGVSILVSACPCILGFIVPLIAKMGITKAGKQGIYFKTAEALQKAVSIDTIIFDLNGTLTKGEPIVRTAVSLYPEFDNAKMLAYFASLEKDSKHAIGRAIYEYYQQNYSSYELPSLTERDEKKPGGVSAIIDGQSIIVGNASRMRAKGIEIPSDLPNAEHMIFLAKEGTLIGYITLSDQLRSDALATINALKKQGKKIRVCTGAPASSALYYTRALGIPDRHVQTECIPIEDNTLSTRRKTKSAYIQLLQRKGCKVAMIGDASNDAIALEKSNLGIAVRSPSMDSMTFASADIVVDGKSLVSIPKAFFISKESTSAIRQNLYLSLGYNVITVLGSVLLTAMGWMINPAFGALLMLVQVALVLANGYRIYKKPAPKIQLVSQNTIEVSEQAWSLCAKRVLHKIEKKYSATHELYQSYLELYESFQKVFISESAPKKRQFLERQALEFFTETEKNIDSGKPLQKNHLERLAKVVCRPQFKKYQVLVIAALAAVGALAAIGLCVAGGAAIGAAVGVAAMAGSIALIPSVLLGVIAGGISLKAGLLSGMSGAAIATGALVAGGAGVWISAAVVTKIGFFGAKKLKVPPEKKALAKMMDHFIEKFETLAPQA